MASFQAKTGRDMLRMIQKKKVIVSIHSNPAQNTEFQNDRKKCKKLRNIIMASFQAKMVLDIPGMTRTIQKKCYGSDPFQPDPE